MTHDYHIPLTDYSMKSHMEKAHGAADAWERTWVDLITDHRSQHEGDPLLTAVFE